MGTGYRAQHEDATAPEGECDTYLFEENRDQGYITKLD